MKRRDFGSILIMTLLLLMVTTLVGMAAFYTSFSEQKIVSNFEDQLRAEQAANTAALWAKAWLRKQCFKPQPLTKPSQTAQPTVIRANTINNRDLTSNTSAVQTLWNTVSFSYPLSSAQKIIPGIAAQPKVIIHELAWDPIRQVQPYRIVAKANGVSKNTTAYAMVTHEKYTPIPELGTRTTQGRGNLFNLKILDLPLAPPASPTPVNWYYLPYSSDNAKGVASSSPDPNRQWFMCIRDDGKVAFRPSGSDVSSYMLLFMQTSFVTLTCNNPPCLPTEMIAGPIGSSLTPSVNASDFTTIPNENPKITFLTPPSGYTQFNALIFLQDGYGFFDFNFVHNEPVGGSNAKPVFTIRAGNGLWLDLGGRVYNPSAVRFNKFWNGSYRLVSSPFVPIQSGYKTVQKVVIEISGDVNP